MIKLIKEIFILYNKFVVILFFLISIFIKNGGVGYGVTNIINYIRRPNVSLLTGKDAILIPIIVNGKIEGVDIKRSGSEYTTPPELEVVGVGETAGTIGQFAKLKAIITDGEITDVNIIDKGSQYNAGNTAIIVTPAGSDSFVTTLVKEWKINSVERYDHVLTEDNSQFIQINSKLSDYNNKICSFYPVKKYRRLLRDNIDSSLIDEIQGHSKIVGWAYDGCLLYTSPSPRDLSTSRMPSSA